MPDVLEMPYTPPLYGAKIAHVASETYDNNISVQHKDDFKMQENDNDVYNRKLKSKYIYRLSSYTCLAGDIIGDYEFDHEINVGDRLIFMDMAIYSMVKNNTFNGIPLPSIAVLKDSCINLVKSFGYNDFKCRLS